MAIRVSPQVKAPNYHLSLTDGTTTVGLKLCDGRGNIVESISKSGYPRAALQTSSGATGWSDFTPPFTPIPQTTWAGGRGAEDLDTDTSRYYDSEGVDTVHGGIVLAGLPTPGTGFVSTQTISGGEGDSNLGMGQGAVELDASSHTTTGAIGLRRVIVPLRRLPTTSNPVTFRVLVYSDSSGPNTEVAASSYRSVELDAVVFTDVTFDITAALSSSTKYWIAIETQANKLVETRKVSASTGNAIMRRVMVSPPPAWVSALSDQALAFRLVSGSGGGAGTAHFFTYRGQLYAATAPDNGGAPAVFMNGYRGVAASNSSDLSKLNTALNLTGVDLAGKVVKIIKGPGSSEFQNWRVITGNTATGTNDSITVNPKWNTAHTNATEYIILGCDTWQDVATMTGGVAYSSVLKYPVTSVVVSEDQVHICQGLDAADAYVIDFCQDNNGGTFRTRFAANGANVIARFAGANVLADGTKKLYFTTSNFEVKTSPAVAYGNNLTPSSAIAIGNEAERITGLRAYGDPSKMYVFKANEFGAISDEDKYARIPLDEYSTCASDRNGFASTVNGVYLFFSFLGGLERYYDQSLDDIGPNRDEGFPEGRQGSISALASYPGRLFAAVDAGDSGYSSVLCYNGTGWHELYRAAQGARVRNLMIQVMPHQEYNKLWMSVDENLVWIPVAINPRKADGYPYVSSGSLTSAWIYGNFKDVSKYWHYLTLHTENLLAGHRTISLEYQLEPGGEWRAAPTGYDTSPTQSVDLSSLYDVTGVRMRYRLTLTTDDPLISPRVKVAVLNSVVRLPVKFMYGITFLAEDYGRDLCGIPSDTTDAKTLMDQLETWANSDMYAAPLLVRSNINEIDGVRVFIEPSSTRLLKVDSQGSAVWIGQATLIGM